MGAFPPASVKWLTSRPADENIAVADMAARRTPTSRNGAVAASRCVYTVTNEPVPIVVTLAGCAGGAVNQGRRAHDHVDVHQTGGCL
jgi:hypothetical protein